MKYIKGVMKYEMGDRVEIFDCQCGGHIHEGLKGEYVKEWSDSALGRVHEVTIAPNCFCNAGYVVTNNRKDTMRERMIKIMLMKTR